jgi:CubicO group peptidase (beta-lactamase class C family)
MDSQALAGILDQIQKQGMHLHSLLVIRHGYLVSETYFYPFGPEIPHEQWSITKAITSAAVGAAVAEGKLTLDQPVLSSFPAMTFTNVDARKKAMTLRDLLTMTAGLMWAETSAPYGNPANTETQMSQSANWVQFVLDRPMAAEPGTTFNYSSGAAHLMSAMIQKATGMTTLAYAQARIFDPLGITHVIWPSDPQGITEGDVGLELTPRDMAKIGYLYLKDGQWDGKQILPASWVQASTERQAGPPPGFGYQWRLTDFGGYAAVGWGSQLIGVMPDQDLVVVITAGVAPGEPGREETLFQMISQTAVKSAGPLPANPTQVARLAAMSAAAAAPDPGPVSPLPPTARAIAGKTFALAGAPDGIQSLSLTFDGTEGTFVLNNERGTQRLALGLDNVYRFSDWNGERIGARGSWQNAQTFVVEEQVLGAADTLHYTLTFTDSQVDGQIAAHIQDHKVPIHGHIAY